MKNNKEASFFILGVPRVLKSFMNKTVNNVVEVFAFECYFPHLQQHLSSFLFATLVAGV